MSKKAEYIETICKKLEECHYKTVDPDEVMSTDVNIIVDRDSYDVKSFKWLPEENLAKLAEFDWFGYASWERAYQEIGRKGYLKFKPYVTRYPDDNPSLVLRHNRFLHMFRGYYFQTSMTVRGQGDAGHSSIRLDSIIYGVEPKKLMQLSKLYYMLYYAALIDCGFKYDSFVKLFNEDRAVVDKFLKDSLNYWRVEFDYDWSDIEGYISDSDEPIIPMEHEHTYEILAKNGAICRFYIDSESIGVEYREKGAIANTCKILRIPDLYDGIELSAVKDGKRCDCEMFEARYADKPDVVKRVKVDEDDLDEFGRSLESCFRYREDKEHMLLVMLLKLCNIHIDWTCSYTLGDLEIFQRANSNEVKAVDSLNDVKLTKEEA